MSDSPPYLLLLGERLARGLTRLSPERRERHRRFVLSKFEADGGFCGRVEGSDLYYTAFAVRTLAMLGELREAEAVRLADYLRTFLKQSLTVIDLVSLLYCALMVQVHGHIDLLAEFHPQWPDKLAELLESFRTADGGYAKTHEGAAGSTYHSFLVALCFQLIGKPQLRPNRLVQFVFDRQREDGGFVEIAPMKRSGTNPTAAAVGILKMLGFLDKNLTDDVTAYLRLVRTDDGGLQANTRIPFADALSTFTGLLTLQDIGAPQVLPAEVVVPFIDSLELPTGGFRGAGWDEIADVEYTFYALGTLGLAWSAEMGR